MLFELPGLRCWCDTTCETAGITISDSDLVPVDHFTCRVLIALLLQLAQGRGWLGIHAAAVVADSVAIILPGPSGCGKTTLFRNAHARGLGVLSDDLVWLHETGTCFQVLPFVKGRSAGELPQPTHRQAPLGAIVCPSILPRGPSRLRAMVPAQAVGVLATQSSFLGSAQWRAERFKSLARAAASVVCFKLEAGEDPGDIPDLLRGLVPRAVANRASGSP
jgi:hypothetical protein